MSATNFDKSSEHRLYAQGAELSTKPQVSVRKSSVSELHPKQLGRMIAYTRKRVFPMSISIAFSVICFTLGFIGIYFGPSISAQDVARRQTAGKSPVETQTPKGVVRIEPQSSGSNANFYLGCGSVILLGVAFGVAASLLCSWELQIREKGLVYQCRRQMHAMFWADITELNVYLNSRPMPSYHLQSHRMKKKVVIWLNEGDDDRMIELLDTKVPMITYWNNASERIDSGV